VARIELAPLTWRASVLAVNTSRAWRSSPDLHRDARGCSPLPSFFGHRTRRRTKEETAGIAPARGLPRLAVSTRAPCCSVTSPEESGGIEPPWLTTTPRFSRPVTGHSVALSVGRPSRCCPSLLGFGDQDDRWITTYVARGGAENRTPISAVREPRLPDWTTPPKDLGGWRDLPPLGPGSRPGASTASASATVRAGGVEPLVCR
jgi:hypothetical protein